MRGRERCGLENSRTCSGSRGREALMKGLYVEKRRKGNANDGNVGSVGMFAHYRLRQEN